MDIKSFRAKTKEHIKNADQIERDLKQVVDNEFSDYGLDAECIDVILTGSRARGYNSESSDLDAIVRYAGAEREDTVFNVLAQLAYEYNGLKVDFNPIKTDITEELESQERHMKKMKEQKSKEMSKSAKATAELIEMLKHYNCTDIFKEKETLSNETLYRVTCIDAGGDEIIYTILNDGSVNMKDDSSSVNQAFKSVDELKKSLFLNPKMQVEPVTHDTKKKLYRIVVRK